ncbi:IS5 family transposase [Halogranum rubrum]|uniref:Transposase IS4 family protein n=1 Tax=Halogranum salarium B-1 TaxID=1210908 RepID=J2ZW94_9EURY|nr:IS5 family transposase [Halogranum salarium]EJN57298.1 transposase IS4 family protein [Halogranum salarium B-1]
MPTQLARFTDHCVDLSQKAVVGEPQPPLQRGNDGYADWVIVAIHCLREYLDQPYRRLLDILHEMPRITAKLGLSVDELPDFTTVCTRKQDLEMRIWRVLLRSSASLHDFGEVQAIDATGFQRHKASRHYVIRVGYNFDDIKTTALVDCDSTAILDVHCSMKQPHDTQIGKQVLTRNLQRLNTVVADKGYDWDALRHELRDAGIRPVIKHREFYPLDMAHNARHDEEVYHRRSLVESIFFALKHRFGETLRARTWFGQFRELVLKSAVRNIEQAVKTSD